MSVKRIVTNIATDQIENAKAFYGDMLGMEIVMDLGWIMTFASPATTRPQISVATQGGSAAPVPDISVEIDDFDDVLHWMREAGYAIVYGPVVEPWNVERFIVRDPFGRLVNILRHT
jgi:catechol 2,3-dioxygenase-like lactoylglutathione lyase family enzyme